MPESPRVLDRLQMSAERPIWDERAKGYQLAEESVEALQAKVRALEERVSELEEAVKPANLATSVAKRQRDLSV